MKVVHRQQDFNTVNLAMSPYYLEVSHRELCFAVCYRDLHVLTIW